MNRKHRAKEIEDQIRNILLCEWDPIGIAGLPNEKDEYDCYVGGVYRLLSEQASAEQIAQHLYQIEISSMGLSSRGPEQLRKVALKLCALDVRL